MSQTKLMSLIEVKTDIGIGFIGSWLLTMYALPLLGFYPNAGEATTIVIMFTIWSIIRKYSVRRFFNWLSINDYTIDHIRD